MAKIKMKMSDVIALIAASIEIGNPDNAIKIFKSTIEQDPRAVVLFLKEAAARVEKDANAES